MVVDRYSKVILTVIALELFWLGAMSSMPPVLAQAEATPVIIRGIDIAGDATGFVPVAVVGTYRQLPGGVSGLLDPATVRVSGSVPVTIQAPVKVEADRPLPIQSVPYIPQQRPGE